MLKRFAMLVITAVVAVVPVTAAHASSPAPGIVRLDQPCILKKIKPPTTKSVFDQAPTTDPADHFDPENKYADDDGTHTTVESDATVEHDDMTYGSGDC